LPAYPVISVQVVVDHFGVTHQAARDVLGRLEGLGVLAPVRLPVSGPGRPARWWVAAEVVDLVGRWA
ncbi:MAG: hypothetical protein ACRDV0_04945, partial [Acidimicrobiales bacterium]